MLEFIIADVLIAALLIIAEALIAAEASIIADELIMAASLLLIIASLETMASLELLVSVGAGVAELHAASVDTATAKRAIVFLDMEKRGKRSKNDRWIA